jgi:beta-1,2-mannobiose phosphorylase / 1,2-beta-oligomannan phosphorylase
MPFPELARFAENPLISPEDISPSEDFLRVEGVFNPAAVREDGLTTLVCRVAEGAAAAPPSGAAAVPVIGEGGRPRIVEVERDGLDLSDPRLLRSGDGRVRYLSSLSHLRAARSRDGRRFSTDEAPLLVGRPGGEEWGLEDPRMVRIEGRLCLSYTAVSPNGAAVALAAGADIRRLERIGTVLPPPNKDAALFPERIGGLYWMLHRPYPDGIGEPDIWIASSPDLAHWGNHSRLLGAAEGGAWESMKIGAGAPPLRTRSGWLLLYHGVDARERYSVGAALLDARDPRRVIARSREPLMEAERDYERKGFFGGAVFPCGAYIDGDDLTIYYGAADRCVCGAFIPLEALLSRLERDPA